MRKSIYPILLLSLSMLLASCGGSSSSAASSSAGSSSLASSSAAESSIVESSQEISSQEESSSQAPVSFHKQKMDTVVYDPNSKTQLDVYFLESGLEHVPFIKITDYYKTLLNHDLSINKTGDGVFSLHSAAGGEATIDTNKRTLVSPDIEQFISTSIIYQENITNVYYDGSPFLKILDATMDTAPEEKTMDFASYGIPLYAYEDDILLPVQTASNLFQGPTMLTCFYNGETIYFINPNNMNFETSGVTCQEDYLNKTIRYFFPNGKRSEEEAKLSYHELCFFIDNYYGMPGREALHFSLNKYRSLDKALEYHDQYTKLAQGWLQSTDAIEYYAGYEILHDYLYDAGHSQIAAGVMTYLEFDPEAKQKVTSLLQEHGYTSGQARCKRNFDADYYQALVTERTAKGIENKKYIRQNDTLLYTFDSFMFDLQGWKDFYKNGGEMPSDEIGSFKRMLDAFKDDSSIKNVVLDLSNNGGGSADMVILFMSLMGKPAYIHHKDILGNNYVTTRYAVDKNFDGVFDERDDAVTYPYRFSILSSGRSFSCGNLLPTQAKEQGILLLGDTSGGGSCAVLDGASLEGLYVRTSSQIHLTMKDGTEVDTGIAPHFYTYYRDYINDKDDFSKFFDISYMSQLMDLYYQ